ncbi:MAG: EAL domain-containing protein [Beijerinckiaceae bacterium]
MSAAAASTISAPPSDGAHVVDPGTVLSSIGEAVYDWDISSDHLSWSGDPLALLRVPDLDRINNGNAFNGILDPISPATRNEAILLGDGQDTGGGVPYRLLFAVRPPKSQALWFEDTGRWFAGADGRPVAAHGVIRRIEAPTEAERSQLNASKFDELTGAYQRSLFLRVMADDLHRAHGKQKKSLFFLTSIDDLDFVNQTYGYEVADQVIAGVARRLKGVLRRKDRMVRHSGAKLGLLLSPYDPEDVKDVVSRFRSAVSEAPFQTGAGSVAVSLILGGVMAPADGKDPIDILRKSEEALNDAKAKRHRGGYAMYKADVGRDQQRKLNLSASDDVLRALNDRRIVPAYEPVLDSRTGKAVFHEALVRVRTSDNGLLGAGAIIPSAERFGLIKFVDIRILELALQRLVERPTESVSVNVSMRTALSSEWIAALSAGLTARPDVARRLIVEVTETAAMADVDATADILRKVKALGCLVAIDDFGSGHTSFRSLRALPVDILKIDGVFVQNIARSTDDRFFVRTLLDLAKHLNVRTVAEWVQDAESAVMLAEWGVDYLQGEFCGHAAVEQAETLPRTARAAG